MIEDENIATARQFLKVSGSIEAMRFQTKEEIAVKIIEFLQFDFTTRINREKLEEVKKIICEKDLPPEGKTIRFQDLEKIKELSEIITKTRGRLDVVTRRQYLVFFLRKNTNYSLSRIGIFIGRDHASVHHSINKIEDYFHSNDIEMLEYCWEVEEMLIKYGVLWKSKESRANYWKSAKRTEVI